MSGKFLFMGEQEDPEMDTLIGRAVVKVYGLAPPPPDPCEYNPEKKAARVTTDPDHGPATVSIGNGMWHLCDSCAALPEFTRFKPKRLKRASP